MRAIIRVIMQATTDEEAVAVKKKIVEAVKGLERVDVELATMGS